MNLLHGISLGLALVAGPGAAQNSPVKFAVDGAALIYDTHVGDGGITDIEAEDIPVLRALLSANPDITVLQLNSGGGSVFAAQTMSDIVLDFGLDTRVDGDCDSSCVTIFLAGTNRTMSRGSRLGFHPVHWSAENIADYFAREADDFGWDSPWEFAAWMYQDTQQEVYRALNYMVSRGVDPAFAIQSIRRPAGDLWRPHRTVLRAAGVLTE